MRRLILPLIILPFNVVVNIPAIIYYLSYDRSDLELIQSNLIQQITGVLFVLIGLAGAVRTFNLFWKEGEGTLAPWDPPEKLVIQGPYRYVRNPMISSVILILLGESFFLQNSGILYWTFLFFLVNNIYIPLFEEKQLYKRFGREYQEYKSNVPMWVPRLRPWESRILYETKNQTESHYDQQTTDD